MTDQKKLIDSFVEDLLNTIHKYDDTLYSATVVGCLEFVKQQLIDEAKEDEHDQRRSTEAGAGGAGINTKR